MVLYDANKVHTTWEVPERYLNLSPVGSGAFGQVFVDIARFKIMKNIVVNNIIIIITRPKPPSGRQGLVGSWGKDTVRQVHYKMFSTSHFAPTALSSNWILLCLNVVIKTHL